MPPASENSDSKKRKELWALLTTVLGAVAAATVGFGTLFVAKFQAPDSIVLLQQTQQKIDSITQNVKDMEKELQVSRELLEKIKSTAPAPLQIAHIHVQLDSLQAHMKMLDDAIGQSPDRALAVPLLRKDLDNLKDSYHRDLDNTQAEINRVYDQNKWFLGLMFTMALGLIGLAVSNFLQLRK